MANERTRDTPWRQGGLIPPLDLGLPEYEYALVISHDCDLAADTEKEPDVEVLLGKRLDSGAERFVYGKSPRKIALEFEADDGPFWLEFSISSRSAVPKSSLFDHQPYPAKIKQPDTLRRWLGERYNRSAFPNDFEVALPKEKLKAKLKPQQASILAVLFGLESRSPSDDSPKYRLAIKLVYQDPNVATELGKLAEDIAGLFNNNRVIDLDGCEAVLDFDMTLGEYLRYQRFHPADGPSYRSDPPAIAIDQD